MPSLWKKPVEKVVLNVAAGLAKSRRSVVTVAGIDESEVDANRFVAAFCGTGTGHFTQTLAVIKILQKAGMTLAAVITVRRALRDPLLGGGHTRQLQTGGTQSAHTNDISPAAPWRCGRA
tara:strand:- start:1559 stop:1918 length:360 start_codon:yes stop_codon:yes gene_type:complete